MSDSHNNSYTEDVFKDENDIVRQRVQKLEDWRNAGIDPYGQKCENFISANCAKEKYVDLEEGEVGETVKITGRLMAIRKMGKSIFADLKDETGKIQLYVGKKILGEDQFELFKKLDIGDIISAEGILFKTRMGEISIKLKEFHLLSKIIRPLPEKFHGLTDVEQRYRQRYVDMIANPEVIDTFRKRSAIIREIRNYMEEKGYLEFETPMLQSLPGGAAAKPFETFYNALDSKMFMRIAPELYLKRLLVGGFTKVFELNRNFRNEGLSKKHNPEFTVLEAYEAFGDCRTMMDLVEEMVIRAAEKVIGTLEIKHSDDKVINLNRPWRRVSYHDLILEYASEDWFSISKEEKLDKAKQLGIKVDETMSEIEITHEIYDRYIEQRLIQPTFVTRVPKHLVPLAKTCKDNPELVDVYELVINGQEMAPGYSELNDPIEQRKRFEAQVELTAGTEEEESGKIDEDFLTALEYGMPPAGGMGIGIDRLVMLLTASETIRDVIAFPQMRQV